MSTAWHRNRDLQWHDSDVERLQQDQRQIESYQHWVESYINNVECYSNAFTERNEEKECDYTSFKSNIKLIKHFDFKRLILKVN